MIKNTREQKLRELVIKWREEAKEAFKCPSDETFISFNQCADELAAVLDEEMVVSAEMDEGDITDIAIAICEADGGDPNNLLWTGGYPPEPWGDEWCRYRKHAIAALKAINAQVPSYRLVGFINPSDIADLERDGDVSCLLFNDYSEEDVAIYTQAMLSQRGEVKDDDAM